MPLILSEFLIPVIMGIVNIVVIREGKLEIKKLPFEKKLSKKLSNVQGLSLSTLIVSLITGFYIFVIHIIIDSFSIIVKEFTVPAIVVISLLVHITLFFYVTQNKKFYQLFKHILTAGCILLLCEVFVFNGKSFSSEREFSNYDLSKITLGANSELKNGDILINGDSSLTLTEPEEKIHTIIMKLDQEHDKEALPFSISVNIKDDNFSEQNVNVQSKRNNAGDVDLSFTINPYGKLHELLISFTEMKKPVTLSQFTISSAIPFSFSSVRFITLLVLAAIIICIRDLKLYSIEYDKNKRSHFIVVQAVILLCTLSATLFYLPDELGFEYDPDIYHTAEPYSIEFDSVKKGIPYLDIEVSEELANYDKIYDKSARDGTDIFYYWDFAFHNGHYYLYFGIAPVIAFYLPFYAATGKVPYQSTAVAFFATLAIFFFCQFIFSVSKNMVKKLNLVMLLVLIPSAVTCIGAFTLLNRAFVYYVPFSSGLCGISLCLWMAFEGYTKKKMLYRNICLFISGAGLVICAASRPGMALCSLVLTPIYIDILLDKKLKLSSRIINASAFLVPVLAGAGAIMAFNNYRFGSPFDFGAAYQLTVSDVHANKLRLISIPPMLYHYFLQLPRARATFPFFEEPFYTLYNYTSYIYTSGCYGVLGYPIMLIGSLLAPFHLSKKSTDGTKSHIRENSFMLLCFGISMFIAWENFCLGGVANRYLFDFMPLLSAALTIVLLRANAEKMKSRYIITALSSFATVFIVWMLLISDREANILHRLPNLYDTLEDLIVFWQ